MSQSSTSSSSSSSASSLPTSAITPSPPSPPDESSSSLQKRIEMIDRREASFRPKRYFLLREELMARNKRLKQSSPSPSSSSTDENHNKNNNDKTNENVENSDNDDDEYLEWRSFLLQQKRKTGFMHKVQLSPQELLHLMEMRTLRRKNAALNSSNNGGSGVIDDESSMMMGYSYEPNSAERDDLSSGSTSSISTTASRSNWTNASSQKWKTNGGGSGGGGASEKKSGDDSAQLMRRRYQNMYQSFMRGNPWTTQITRVSFANNDSNLLAFASLDGCISIASVLSDKGILCELNGHEGCVLDIAWSTNNDYLLSVAKDCTIRVWSVGNVSSPKCLRVIQDQSVPTSVAFHPFNNNLFLVGFDTLQKRKLLQQNPASDSTVTLYNLSTGKPVVPNKVALKTSTSVQKIGGAIHGFNYSDFKDNIGTVGGRNGVTCMCFSTHADMLFVGDAKGFVTVLEWDPVNALIKKKPLAYKKVSESGQRVTSLHYSQYTTQSKQINPCLIVNACDNNVHLYRVTAAKMFQFEFVKSFSIPHQKNNVRSMFSPLLAYGSGAYFASGSEASEVYLFDVESAENDSVQKVLGHTAPVVDVSWSYDELFLASGDTSGVVIVWKRTMDSDDIEASVRNEVDHVISPVTDQLDQQTEYDAETFSVFDTLTDRTTITEKL